LIPPPAAAIIARMGNRSISIRHTAVLIILACGSAQHARAFDDPPATEPDLATVEKAAESEKKAAFARATQRLNQIKGAFRKLPRGADRARQELNDKLAALEKEVADLRSGKKICLPKFNFAQAQVGTFGRMEMEEDKQWVSVVQALGPKEFIAT